MIYGYARVSRPPKTKPTGAPVEGGRMRKGVPREITGTTADRPQLRALMKFSPPATR